MLLRRDAVRMEAEGVQRFEDMDLDDLALWLEDNDVPYEFCKIMKGKLSYSSAGAFVS